MLEKLVGGCFSSSSMLSSSGYAYASCSSSVSGITTPSGTWRHTYMSCFSRFFLRPFQTTSCTTRPGSAPFHDGNAGRFGLLGAEDVDGPFAKVPVPTSLLSGTPPFSDSHSLSSSMSIPRSDNPCAISNAVICDLPECSANSLADSARKLM